MVNFIKRILGIYSPSESFRDKCYKSMEDYSYVCDKKCPGQLGGTKMTDYLCEMCIGCKYHDRNYVNKE